MSTSSVHRRLDVTLLGRLSRATGKQLRRRSPTCLGPAAVRTSGVGGYFSTEASPVGSASVIAARKSDAHGVPQAPAPAGGASLAIRKRPVNGYLNKVRFVQVSARLVVGREASSPAVCAKCMCAYVCMYCTSMYLYDECNVVPPAVIMDVQYEYNSTCVVHSAITAVQSGILLLKLTVGCISPPMPRPMALLVLV